MCFSEFRVLCVSVSSGKRIEVAKPVVELDGDEMTRIIWEKIKEQVGSGGAGRERGAEGRGGRP